MLPESPELPTHTTAWGLFMFEKYDPDPIIEGYVFPTSFEPAGTKMVELT